MGDNLDALVAYISSLPSIDGRYSSLSPLGTGRVGTFSLTFAAEDATTKTSVVLKFMNPLAEPYRQRAFEREVHVAGILGDSEHIVKLVGGRSTLAIPLALATGGSISLDVPFAAFERGNENFASYLLGRIPSLLSRIKAIRGIAKGLYKLHKSGFCHRDLKPENIFIYSGGVPRIGDFGTCRSTDSAERAYEDDYSGPVGDLGYCAPELLLGQWNDRSLFCGADWFSFGAVLFEAVTNVNIYTVLGLRADIQDIVRTFAALSESDRKSLFNKMAADVAGQYPIPTLADAVTGGDHLVRTSTETMAAVERLVRSTLHFDHRRRETRFDRIIRAIDIAAGHARLDEKKWAAARLRGQTVSETGIGTMRNAR